MKWFKHDSDSSLDAKLKRVRMKYGMEGYGLYWYCLELIAQTVEKHNLTFELEHDAELISLDTNIHQERTQEMMLDFVKWGLFENSDGVITCLKMATRTDEYTQKLIRTQTLLLTQSGQTPDSVPTKSLLREEKRREEKQPSESYDSDFDAFWKSYPKKEAKKKAGQSWKRLTVKNKELALKDIQSRFNETDKQFIPLAATYLNGERWNDEITTNNSNPSDYAMGAI